MSTDRKDVGDGRSDWKRTHGDMVRQGWTVLKSDGVERGRNR